MSDDKPRPPVPPPPPPPPPPRDGVSEDYQTIAETVGMMPSLRTRDNIIQALVVAIGSVLGAIIGGLVAYLGHEPVLLGLLVGLVIGLIAATLISGFVLMILGLKRAARRRSGTPGRPPAGKG